MLWFYLVLFSIVGTAIANIFRRISMKDDKSDVVASAIAFQFLGAGIVGIVALLHGFIMPPIFRYPLNIILQAIFWGSATLSLFQASKYLEAVEVAIITAGNTITTILTAMFFLHESFGLLNVLGTILILASIFLISHKRRISFNKGTFFAFLYCIFAGLGNTNDAFMLRYSHSDTLSLLTLGFFAPGVFLMLVKPSVVKKFAPIFQPRYLIKISALTFFYVLAAITYFFAIHVGAEASRASAISQSEIILTVIIGALVLHETDHPWKKVFATLLVMVGVVLLS